MAQNKEGKKIIKKTLKIQKTRQSEIMESFIGTVEGYQIDLNSLCEFFNKNRSEGLGSH